MKSVGLKPLVKCAVFAALCAVVSPITIPIGPIPINFTHLLIFVAAGMMGPWYAGASQVIFVLLGAFGLPVFSGYRGGVGVIAGPTGGFILSYAVCAVVVGLLIRRFGKSAKVMAAAMYCGWAVTYLFGISWYMFTAKAGMIPAVTVCMLPFLPGDAIKTVLSVILLKKMPREIME